MKIIAIAILLISLLITTGMQALPDLNRVGFKLKENVTVDQVMALLAEVYESNGNTPKKTFCCTA